MNTIKRSLNLPRKIATTCMALGAFSSVSMHPAFANAVYQPFKCKGDATFNIEKVHDEKAARAFGIDGKHVLKYKLKSGKVGFGAWAFRTGTSEHRGTALKSDKALSLYFRDCDLDKTFVRCLFIPFGDEKRRSIEKPLSAFKREKPTIADFPGYWEASITGKELLGDETDKYGLAYIIVTATAGSGEFCRFNVYGKHANDTADHLVTEDGGCQLANRDF